MTSQKIAIGLVAVALLSSSLSILAQTTGKDLVRVFNVITTRSILDPDRLNEVAFSIHNRADRPLEWVKIRIIVRNPAKEAIHSEAKEINFVKYMGKPLAPGAIMQMSESLYIRGYRTSRGSGSVEVRLMEYWFSQ